MIDSFKNEFAFLSNFAQVTVNMYGKLYPSVEHAFQAAKTLDPVQRENIRAAPTAAAAKKMGREVTLRPDWDEFRLVAMETLLRRKFAHPGFAQKLVATHPHELVEGNYWKDYFWGVCNGRGENHLGRLLMKIRSDLLSQSQIATDTIDRVSTGESFTMSREGLQASLAEYEAKFGSLTD